MRVSTVTGSLALAAGASANYNGSVAYTTEIVDVYTTYCPYATQLTYNSQTYTVTEVSQLLQTDARPQIQRVLLGFFSRVASD